MTASSWTQVTTRVMDSPTEHAVLIPFTAPRQFFRPAIPSEEHP
jgi:hypothetical protein